MGNLEWEFWGVGFSGVGDYLVNLTNIPARLGKVPLRKHALFYSYTYTFYLLA